MELTGLLLEIINQSDGYTVKKIGINGALFIPNIEQQYYMPNLVVKDLEELESALAEYITVINSSSLLFYKINDRHKIRNYLFYLIKSLSNTDCQDFNAYIRRFTTYLKDYKFNDLNYSRKIGKIDKYNLFARRCEEYYGSETPFTMHYYVEIPGFKFEMPLIRYGISDENKAYIYSVQRKKLYNNNNCRIKAINKVFNGVNKGVRNNRNVTPTMLCSLTIFMGMLKSQGVTNIKADGFLTRRYGYFYGVTEEEQRNEIQHNAIDKFNKLFLRLSDQFDGIGIQAYPLDIDSYFHLAISDMVASKNDLLNNLYNIGLNYQTSKEKTLSLHK